MKTDNQLNAEAIQLREKWGLNPNGSIDITSVVLSKLPNLTLLYIPFSENTSGMCINDGNIKIIGINSTMTKGRQRFTLAHELYHLLIEENTGKPIICNNPYRDDSEREADKFASYLLMSEEGLSQYCDMNNIDDELEKVQGELVAQMKELTAEDDTIMASLNSLIEMMGR